MHDSLAASLDALIASHEELMAIATEKQGAIIGNDIEALNRLVHRERKLVNAIADQELDRERLARELLAALGVPSSEPVTLSAVIRCVTGAEAKLTLSRCRDRLIAVLESLSVQNERNQQLIAHALRYVNYSLDLFSYSPMDDVTYRPPAQGMGKTGGGFFNTRI